MDKILEALARIGILVLVVCLGFGIIIRAGWEAAKFGWILLGWLP